MPSGHQHGQKSSPYPSELQTPENKEGTFLTATPGLADLTWFRPGSDWVPVLAPIAKAGAAGN